MSIGSKIYSAAKAAGIALTPLQAFNAKLQRVFRIPSGKGYVFSGVLYESAEWANPEDVYLLDVPVFSEEEEGRLAFVPWKARLPILWSPFEGVY